jgi:hypothetical protein
MSPRNKVLQTATPFDTYSDAKEPLIAPTGADAEKEDQGLEERALYSFKLSSLLLGLLLSYFFHFSALGASCLVMGNGSVGGGKDLVIKSTIDIVGFSILTMLVPILLLIRNLAVTIAYSAVGGRSKELLQDMIWQLQCDFGVGTVAGACLAWTIMGIMDPLMLCSLAIMVVVLYWYKVTMASAGATHSKPLSTRPSTAEQTTMMIV